MRVITWNADGSPDDLARADLIRLLNMADVVCVQTSAERNDLFTSVTRSGYELYQPATRGGGAKTLLMWRSKGRVTPLENSYYRVGEPGTGSAVGADALDFRYLSCTRFRFYTGRTFWVASHQVVPQIHGTGSQARRTMAEIALRRTATWLYNQREVAILGGDCGLSPDDELFEPLRTVSADCDQEDLRTLVTHQGLASDMFWSRGAHLHDHHIIDTHGDHFALYAHYALS